MTDRVEREIQVYAPIERVFSLVSEPGWWIEDGPDRVVTHEGDVTIVELPQHGRFPVLPVSSDAPRHVAFRGGAPGQEAGDGALVEFFLSEHEGGTKLRVVETGPGYAEDEHGRVEGWGIELAAAKGRAEGVAV